MDIEGDAETIIAAFRQTQCGLVISPIHTFVNIPALIRKDSVFLSSRAGILTKV
jgi:hypothetical protein